MKDGFMGEVGEYKPQEENAQNTGDPATDGPVSEESVDHDLADPDHEKFSDIIFDNLKLAEAKKKLAELLLEIEKLRADTDLSTADFKRMTVVVGRLLSLEDSQQEIVDGLYATFNEDEFSPVEPAELQLLEDIRSAQHECNDVIKAMVATAYPDSSEERNRVEQELTVLVDRIAAVESLAVELHEFYDLVGTAAGAERTDTIAGSNPPADLLSNFLVGAVKEEFEHLKKRLKKFNTEIAQPAGFPQLHMPTADIRSQSKMNDVFTESYNPVDVHNAETLPVFQEKIGILIEQLGSMEDSLVRQVQVLQNHEEHRIEDLRETFGLDIP